MKRILFIFTLIPFLTLSQNWVDMMQDPNNNFYQTQNAFNDFWEGRTIEKGKGGSNLKDGKILLNREFILMVSYSPTFFLKKVES